MYKVTYLIWTNNGYILLMQCHTYSINQLCLMFFLYVDVRTWLIINHLFYMKLIRDLFKNHPDYVPHSQGIAPYCIKVMIQYYNIDYNHYVVTNYYYINNRSSQICGNKGSLVKVPNTSIELYLTIVFSISM
jgi:hypothetical protein